jgi:hypothetical protein
MYYCRGNKSYNLAADIQFDKNHIGGLNQVFGEVFGLLQRQLCLLAFRNIDHKSPKTGVLALMDNRR